MKKKAIKNTLEQQYYSYPMIFTEEDGDISVQSIDFEGCISCGSDNDDASRMAAEALALTLVDILDNNETIPEKKSINNIKLKKNQKIVYVAIWLPYHIAMIEEAYTKKTLTIPTWLNLLGMGKNINFSAILVKGLKEELGLNRKKRG